MPKPSDWFPSVVEVIERFTDRWALAGALAAIQYRREGRFTKDADLLVEWHEGIPPALESEGYSVRSMADRGEHPFLLLVRRGVERTDLIFPVVEYQEIALERGAPEHVLTVEDVIIHKLIAWRLRDRGDIGSILQVGHDIDTDYVERWAEFWEVIDRWHEATETGRPT